MRNDELMHYGVLGMKWGVKRARRAAEKGNTDKAIRLYLKTYKKSSRSIDKVHSKSVKTNLESAKLQKKALKQANDAISKGNNYKYQQARKKELKAATIRSKSAKQENKAMKLEKKMEKTFGDVLLKDVNKRTLVVGKEYIDMYTVYFDDSKKNKTRS